MSDHRTPPTAATTPTAAANAPARRPGGSIGAVMDDARPRERWHSVSSTREYERCPRRYRYAYVDRLPQDRHVPPAWRIGTAVHAALEAAYRQRMSHPSEPLDAALPAALVALRTSWDELELGSEDGAYRRAGEHVERTLRHDVLGPHEVLGVELPLRDDASAGPRIVGMVDLALRLGPTTVQIVDHKVTGWRRRPDELAQDLQLNLYGALARKLWPGTTAVIATLHYPTGPEQVSTRLTAQGMAAARARVVDVARTADSDATFTPTPGAHCDHCPWRSRCPAVT